MARRIGGVAPVGLVIAAAGIILLIVLFDLSSVASIGSAVALGIFALVTIGHLRIRQDTGAHLSILLVALLTTSVTLLTFVFTTLVNEPARSSPSWRSSSSASGSTSGGAACGHAAAGRRRPPPREQRPA